MNTTFLSARFGAFAGLIGASVFAGLWGLAVAADGHWVLGEMTLSELGDRSRNGAFLFDAAAIIAGVLGIFYAVGLYRVLSTSALGKLGTTVLGVASLLLVGIGLFPVYTGELHTILSYGFFLLTAVALALLIVPIWRSHVLHPSGGAITAVLLIVPILSIPFLPLPAVEALAVGCLLLWTALISVRMIWHHPVG